MSIYYVKIVENGILVKYIPGLQSEFITLPNDVHTVGINCFNPWEPDRIPVEDTFELENWGDYFKVKTIAVPSNIENIQRLAFGAVPNLESFTVAPDCSAAMEYDGALFTKDGKALICCLPKKEGDFTIPDGVETIWENAFDSTCLSRVFLPNSATSIEEDAFSYAFNLEEIYIPSSVTSIGQRAFDGCSMLTIMAPGGSHAIEYAQANGIPCVDIDEVIVCKKANKVKEEYWILCANKSGEKFRRKKFGYKYEWNGYAMYSDYVTPIEGCVITEGRSGMRVPSLDALEARGIENVRKIFDKLDDVMLLPTEDEL